MQQREQLRQRRCEARQSLVADTIFVKIEMGEVAKVWGRRESLKTFVTNVIEVQVELCDVRHMWRGGELFGVCCL